MDPRGEEILLRPLDPGQIKKAALALLAWSKNEKKTAQKLLLNEDQKFFLMFTVWKIPQREQIIKIPLPHNIQPATVEVISYKTLKKEYKPFEAKRRLLARFTLFLSDDRIRRLLPSHIGKHFYKSKKAPLSVNLRAKNLAKEINKHIQGTILPVTNKGCCYAAHIGHTGMDAEKISENIVAAAKVIAAKAPQGAQAQKKKKKTNIKKKGDSTTNAKGDSTTIINESDAPDARRPDLEMVCISATGESEEEDGEIPQLVPIETSSSVKRKKVVQPSPAPGRKVKPDTKGSPTLFGKRKKFPSLGTPEVHLEIPGDGSGLQTPNLLKQYKMSETPKQKGSEKKQGGETQKPAAKSSQTPKMVKTLRSSKKIPKTPAQELKKVKVPQLA
ncbi:hypothetical protein JD844_019768 [Phrynosoma platyrhinos]|uniref:Ribosomal L1 domain-containing protein 1 n=1 Tax=Phrynosoma platyrhinos TaxID=52577 RepID=A0ABQ7TPY8_PHRPL|nr:hypothetical protein JD844_019768 [Phrynosoma platyrhinos]